VQCPVRVPIHPLENRDWRDTLLREKLLPKRFSQLLVLAKLDEERFEHVFGLIA
jgi:hypothetical protein